MHCTILEDCQDRQQPDDQEPSASINIEEDASHLGMSFCHQSYQDLFRLKALQHSTGNKSALQSTLIEDDLVYLAPVLEWDAATLILALEGNKKQIAQYIGFDLIEGLVSRSESPRKASLEFGNFERKLVCSTSVPFKLKVALKLSRVS